MKIFKVGIMSALVLSASFFVQSNSINVNGNKLELISLAHAASTQISAAFFPQYMKHSEMKELEKRFTELWKKINQSPVIRDQAAMTSNADRYYYKNTVSEAIKFLGNDKNYENQEAIRIRKEELYDLMEQYKKKFGKEYPLNYKALTFTINKDYVEKMYLNCEQLHQDFLANPNMRFPSYFKTYFNAFKNHPEDYNVIDKNIPVIINKIKDELGIRR